MNVAALIENQEHLNNKKQHDPLATGKLLNSTAFDQHDIPEPVLVLNVESTDEKKIIGDFFIRNFERD